MNKNPLKIVATDDDSHEPAQGKRINPRTEAQAKFDRLWLQNPEVFDYTSNSREMTRIKRTFDLINDTISPKEKKVADLGCGKGYLTYRIRDAGGYVDAVDISQNALKQIETKDGNRITTIHDYIPHSNLADNHYDIVVGTELIADLDPNMYRVFFSELARIVTPEGYVICSTPIDIQSEDALQKFAELASTEFDIIKWVFSYHYLQIRLLDFFIAPSRFVRANNNEQYKSDALSRRYSLSKWWFKINSSTPISWIWKLIHPIAKPIARLIEGSTSILLCLEKLTKYFWRDSGVSHAIFIAKRRAFIPPTDKKLQPKELKHKKQVWE